MIRSMTANKDNLEVSGLGLYGRTEEKLRLEESYEHGRLTLISGPSGRGKSALSRHLRGYSCKRGGLFVSGKYTFSQEGEPYSAITQACKEICRTIASDDVYSPCCNALRQELGLRAIRALSRVIPGIEEVLEYQLEQAQKEDAKELNYVEDQNLLQISFRRFFQVICEYERVVLALDDLQWADPASLQLLEFLLADEKNASLLVIFCYRDDEVNETHMFARLLRNIAVNHKALDAMHLKLEDLSVKAVEELIGGAMGKNSKISSEFSTAGLAKVIHKKTRGNPFFTLQFLSLLGNHGLVSFNESKQCWDWNLDEVQVFASTIDDVVDLMQNKIKMLSFHVQNLAQLAACLGTTIRTDLFQIISEAYYSQSGHGTLFSYFGSLQQTTLEPVGCERFFDELRRQEILETVTDGESYRWCHDKIQEAAYKLMAKPKSKRIQYKLGNLLSEKLNRKLLRQNLFTVVRLMNASSFLIPTTDSTKRVALAEMNLEAGKLSLACSDFQAAKNHFGKAVSLLPPNKWRVYNELCVELHSLASEADCCTGSFTEMEYHCDQVIRHPNLSLLQKRRAYTSLMEGLSVQGKPDEAMELCITLLDQLDCNIPRHAVLLRILPGLMHAKVNVEKNTRKTDPSTMKKITDETKLWVMTLLDNLFNYAYLANRHDILAVATVRSYQWTTKFGFCYNTPTAYARIGLALAANVTDVRGGVAYASCALEFLSYMRDKRVACKAIFVAHAFVLHRVSNLEYHRLLEGHEEGIKAGGAENACWCSHFALEYQFMSGKIHLDVLHVDARAYSSEMRELRQDSIYDYVILNWQVIANLRGEGTNTGGAVLTGEMVDESEMMRAIQNGEKLPFSRFALRRSQYYIAFWFEDWERCVEIRKDATEADFVKNVPGALCTFLYIAYSCHAMLSMYRIRRKRKYWRIAMSGMRQLKLWVSQQNPSFVTLLWLAEAEKMNLRGVKQDRVQVMYNKATENARQRGSLHEEALCFQRHGEYCLRQGMPTEGKQLLELAIINYEKWGALGKVKQVIEKHKGVLTHFAQTPRQMK